MAVALREILGRYVRGEISAEIAAMLLLIESEDVVAARAAASDAPAVARLLDENAAGCARIAGMLKSGMDSPEPSRSVDEGIAFARRLFDWSVAQHEETSVALYSLGNADILAAATREVIDELAARCVLEAATVVEIGCGIGRFLAALAGRVKSIHGLDLAPGMVAAARRRCAGLSSVTVALANGRDLGDVPAGSVELVLAVDVFPYIVQAGMPLAASMFAAISRALVPGGKLALFQFSYRGDLERDRVDVATLANATDLTVEVAGERRFKLWDGPVFWLTRESNGSARSSGPPR